MMTRSRETPMSVAVTGSCATARMPRPNLVRLMNRSVARARTSADRMMTSVTFVTGAPPIVNCTSGCTSRIGCSALTPPSSPPVSRGSTKCTNSWSTNDMPIAVMRKTSAGAPRRRSGR
ncbi:hypothetical protein BJF88_12305 [Cellulosimicrobium sp. CUA-896]|nr:hypothetical protein BJF88_12305 [Cellulosimicrobium sp. CUA-896]